MRVLVAEDEQVMADTIAEGLRRRAMAVDVCYDGDAALLRVSVNRHDVVILDRDLPKVHGDQVCRKIVASGAETRVLMLTAAAGLRDRVGGLDLGADRVRTGRGGVGLGLAIVRSIVLAHAGAVRAQPRPGGGLEIEVTLPVARSPAS